LPTAATDSAVPAGVDVPDHPASVGHVSPVGRDHARPHRRTAEDELAGLWTALTGDPAPPRALLDGDPVSLPTRFRVADAAAVAVGLALAVAARLQAAQARDAAPAQVRVDRRAAFEVFRSERHLRVDDAVVPIWDALAGDYRSADGWVKLHTNYAHHRRAALTALGLPDDAERAEVAAVVADLPGLTVEDAVQRAGGAAAALRTPGDWHAHPQSAAVAARPLISLALLTPDPAPGRRLPSGGHPADPSHGGRVHGGPAARGDLPDVGLAGTHGRLRVLDLTRVIAGPTATKVLAALGADVLRVDHPHFEEVPALVPDTTAGKRCARLDLRDTAGRAVFAELLRTADVLVCGLRPGALAGLGWPVEELARHNPGLVLAELSAYGDTGPWAGRRGFDSLVQLVTGIAAPPGFRPGDPAGESGPPVPLPAQALDHATGWLLVAGVLEAVHRRRRDGAGRRVGVVLARTGAWLDALGRQPGEGIPAEPVPDTLVEEIDSRFGRVTRVRCPGTIGGRALAWAGPPAPLGSRPPSWR
jgi:hypothetical protein